MTKDDTRAGTPFPNFHITRTGGRMTLDGISDMRQAHMQRGSSLEFGHLLRCRSFVRPFPSRISVPCPLSQFQNKSSLPIKEFEENLIPDKCSFDFGKNKKALSHRAAIRRKRPSMLSDGVIRLHDNTHTARKTHELLKSSSGKSGATTPYSPDLALNMGSKHLSGTRFSSNSNVKTTAENWLNG
ncbi:hypothetical protein AVEN_122554-1 [Araneus ventricosus]|uniref:Uncharacterized protein n=1 Tax=Araneus ventricosus TaxID=182803 RepID=A0A4Y2IQL0_ARAVE|nr:hypothetical protein AVEN_122554-1 [Araneus ventricosus]